MTRFYILKLLVQLPWLLIAGACIIQIKRAFRWSTLAQLVASAVLVLWVAADWVFWDPHIGVLRGSPPGTLATWVKVQSCIIGVAMPVFAIGFFCSRASRATEKGDA
jgi:hypothetical protein